MNFNKVKKYPIWKWHIDGMLNNTVFAPTKKEAAEFAGVPEDRLLLGKIKETRSNANLYFEVKEYYEMFVFNVDKSSSIDEIKEKIKKEYGELTSLEFEGKEYVNLLNFC